MKFQVEREDLAEAVAWTARSVPTRPTVPVLAGVLLDVTGHQLTVSGFDYEVSTRITLEVTAGEGGTALVSGRLLADITRSLPAGAVEIVTEGSRIVVTCGTARFTLPTLPVEEYPSLPEMPTVIGTIAGADFAAVIGQVAVAAGKDDTLPLLTGVRIEIEGPTLTLAATDRYRLAVRDTAWTPENESVSATALVPARTLSDIARAVPAASTVSVALTTETAGEGMIGFEAGHRRTTTRLLEGEFPKYRSLMPAESAATATVAVAPFVEAIKRMALVTARNAPIRLSFSTDGLVFEAGGGEDAEGSEAMAADYEGDPMTIAFNPTFLLDGLSAVNAETVHLAFTTPTKPAVLTAAAGDEGTGDGETTRSDDDAASYRYLLMPVRLSS